MVPEDLVITDISKEEIFDLKADYPCCVRKVTAQYGRKQIITWHWHEELEFVYVLEGELEYWTAGNRMILKQTEGIFINGNVMHQVTVPEESESVCYLVFMFRPEFLAEEKSFLDKKYIKPVLYNYRFQAAVLSRKSAMQRKILENLQEMNRIYNEKVPGYEMIFRNRTADMWIDFVHMLGLDPDAAKLRTSEKEERLKEMLTFIHREYENDISLSDIAGAAKISKREALRCFQEGIHISPGAYLKEYRLQMACIMLKNTTDTITEIAQNCGFHTASYFGKVFRKQMECTPYEFRKRQ